MNDLRKNKRKMCNKQSSAMSNSCNCGTETEATNGCGTTSSANQTTSGCGTTSSANQTTNGCGQSNVAEQGTVECVCKFVPGQNGGTQQPCQPCQVEADNCVPNAAAGDTCCNGIEPKYSTRNAAPVAIEVNRIYDAVQFQVFTDAASVNGDALYFDYEVVDVRGNIPATGMASITVEEVCLNYSSIEVIPGTPSVEDFEVSEVEDNAPCDTVYEYSVCPDANKCCCSCNKGQSVSYKERGLTVVVHDLVLELRARCGCTRVIVCAYPAEKQMDGSLQRVNCVEFDYNTLSSRICCPSSGESFRIRQSYRVSLTVDSISKAYISKDYGCNCGCGCDSNCGCRCDDGCYEPYDYNFTIPSGIDLICCVEDTVSVLVNDEIVVLAATGGVTPRVVDTFSNVCSFSSCGE